jgi:hypothetical protein
MKNLMRGGLAVLVALGPAGAAVAHHSLANHDTTKAVRIRGTVVQFHVINPHSFIYLEEKNTAGQLVRRWAIEGPGGTRLARLDLQKAVKVGDVIEACGYQPKEATMWQIASADPRTPSLAGRLMTAELIVMPDGKLQEWEDYGFHHCFPSDYQDRHSK